jgi:capsular polysaccharide biosynthesis protein
VTWARTLPDSTAPAWTQSEPTVVPHALLTAFARGPLNTERGPFRWVVGAVHGSDGVLIPESQRRWRGDRHAPVAADPAVVTLPEDVHMLGGTWLYAGHWSEHFGHFLLETLPNLWPDPARAAGRVDGVIVHRPPRGSVPPAGRRVPVRAPDLSPWQATLLKLAGYGDHELLVVHGRPVRVERLVVPARPVLLKHWALTPAVDTWRRVSEAVGRRGPHERVFLSRSRFHVDARSVDRARSDPEWDAALDVAFAQAGFAVVHPETLPIDEQISLVRGAGVLAGPSGSALHLSAFADPGTRVMSIGDRRSPHRPVPAQTMVDSACGRESTFVAYGELARLERVLSTLDA